MIGYKEVWLEIESLKDDFHIAYFHWRVRGFCLKCKLDKGKQKTMILQIVIGRHMFEIRIDEITFELYFRSSEPNKYKIKKDFFWMKLRFGIFWVHKFNQKWFQIHWNLSEKRNTESLFTTFVNQLWLQAIELNISAFIASSKFIQCRRQQCLSCVRAVNLFFK